MWVDFGNMEATEEDWNWVTIWSFVLCIPLAAICGLVVANFRRIPILAIGVLLFSVFHFWTTFAENLLPPPYSDFDLGIPEFSKTLVIFALPFILVFFVWRLFDLLLKRWKAEPAR
jgi:hypothetical protein